MGNYLTLQKDKIMLYINIRVDLECCSEYNKEKNNKDTECDLSYEVYNETIG